MVLLAGSGGGSDGGWHSKGSVDLCEWLPVSRPPIGLIFYDDGKIRQANAPQQAAFEPYLMEGALLVFHDIHEVQRPSTQKQTERSRKLLPSSCVSGEPTWLDRPARVHARTGPPIPVNCLSSISREVNVDHLIQAPLLDRSPMSPASPQVSTGQYAHHHPPAHCFTNLTAQSLMPGQQRAASSFFTSRCNKELVGRRLLPLFDLGLNLWVLRCRVSGSLPLGCFGSLLMWVCHADRAQRYQRM